MVYDEGDTKIIGVNTIKQLNCLETKYLLFSIENHFIQNVLRYSMK